MEVSTTPFSRHIFRDTTFLDADPLFGLVSYNALPQPQTQVLSTSIIDLEVALLVFAAAMPRHRNRNTTPARAQSYDRMEGRLEPGLLGYA